MKLSFSVRSDSSITVKSQSIYKTRRMLQTRKAYVERTHRLDKRVDPDKLLKTENISASIILP